MKTCSTWLALAPVLLMANGLLEKLDMLASQIRRGLWRGEQHAR